VRPPHSDDGNEIEQLGEDDAALAAIRNRRFLKIVSTDQRRRAPRSRYRSSCPWVRRQIAFTASLVIIRVT
jgi:hypothetical protein